MKLLVFGMGYSARTVVRWMRPELERVWGTLRDAGRAGELTELAVEPMIFDGSLHHPTPSPSPQGGGKRAFPPPFWGRAREGADAHTAIKAGISEADYVLVSIPPGADGDPVLQSFGEELAASKPRSLVYLSTVGVYGDHNGAWVDEATPCRPVSRRSRERVAAEIAWRGFGEDTGVPVAIVRLAGIYGVGRGPFEKIRRGTARRIVKPGQVFNRIHVDDIAQIVAAAFQTQANGIYNGTDDEPATPEAVLAYAAELLGLPPPPEVSFAEAEMSAMARSFYGENKRVRNRRIKAELGVQLACPTYRDGLLQVLRAEQTSDPRTVTVPSGESLKQ